MAQKGEDGKRKVRDRIKQCLCCDCPGRFFVSLQPLFYALLVFSVGYYMLCKIGPLELNNAEVSIALIKTQGASPPIHLAFASWLALFVVELAVVGLACYTILQLQRRWCWFFWWIVAFAISLGIFYCFLHHSDEYAVHPIRVIETILKSVIGPEQWSTAKCYLQVLTISAFAPVSGLVMALCGLVWNASRPSSGRVAEKRRIARAVRWSKYLVAAGGLLMVTSAWSQLIWTYLPLGILPRHAPVASDYARAVIELVAFEPLALF